MHSSTEPSILHADLDCFFASVEQRDRPELLGRPVIVGPGVVMAASYEARACGVHSAMSGRTARRLCPDAVVVEPHLEAYTEASDRVFDVFARTTPLVEALSIDEAFLDVRGMEGIAGSPRQIADRLRRAVRAEVGLPITIGVARTKFLAKVASAVAKPDGLLVVPAEEELRFLHPLPIERLWGVGRATSAKLRGHGVITVGDLHDEETLVALLGNAAGRHLHALAQAHDPRPVRRRPRRRSVGSQHALGPGPPTREELEAILLGLVDRVARRLRTGGRSGRTVVLRIRFDDFSRATRSRTLQRPTTRTDALLEIARSLLRATLPEIERRGLTLIGVAVANLDDGGVQLELPFERDRQVALDQALDALRGRFGSRAIVRGRLLGRELRPQVPVLPDPFLPDPFLPDQLLPPDPPSPDSPA